PGSDRDVQLQVSSNQYQALKYLITGGCVTLIFVLLGSMLRLSAADDSSHHVSANSFATPPYPQYPPAPWGYPGYPHTAPPQETEPSDGAAEASGRPIETPAPPHSMPMPMPVSYLPAMPIGIPVSWQTPNATGNPQISASSLQASHPQQNSPSNHPLPIAPEGVSEHEPNTGLADQSDGEIESVEDTLMKQLGVNQNATHEHNKDSSSKPNPEMPFSSANAASPSKLGETSLDEEIRDPIAEDLANLPVETYGEPLDRARNDKDRITSPKGTETHSTASSNQDDSHQSHMVDEAGNRRPVTPDAVKKVSSSIFDAIVANTIEVKSLAS
ncbi:MAG: hypothetical protein ACPHL6_01515, partial [Rubripirellula sp.]